MRKLLYFVIVIVLFLACGGQGRYETALKHAQDIIDDDPDSAMTVLDSLGDYRKSMGESTRMRWNLLRAQAQNKAYIPFTSDSVMREVADYYDRHGSPYDRMMAHYLLGRAYSDMGEAPAALKNFLKAVDQVENTTEEYKQLCIIYLQMNELYYYQNMPECQFEALDSVEHLALLSQDTLMWAYSLEKRASAYDLIGDKDAVLELIDSVHGIYQMLGREDLAAGSLGIALLIDTERGDTAKAGVRLREIEEHSGWVENGAFAKGKELFYYAKGLYALRKGYYQEAERLFRQEMSVCSDYENRHAACRGLRELYQKTGQRDSFVKYVVLAEQYNDSLVLNTNANTLSQMRSLYDYSRHEAAYHEQLSLVAQHRNLSYLLALALLFVAAVAYAIYLSLRRKEERLREENELHLKLYRQAQDDLDLLMEENARVQELTDKKDDEIRKLSGKIAAYNKKQRSRKRKKVDDVLMKAPITKELTEFVDKPVGTFDIEKLEELTDLFNREFPQFYSMLNEKKRISHIEYLVCMLTRLKFSPSEISNILSKTPSSVSLLRKRLYKKLTGLDGAGNDLDDFLFSI